MAAYEKTFSRKMVCAIGGIIYDDPNNLIYASKMRVCAGVLVHVRTPTFESHFAKLGYKQTELPKVRAIQAIHPKRTTLFGLIYAIAAMRAYPVMFDFFEANLEKFKQMLSGKKSVMIELYTNDMI